MLFYAVGVLPNIRSNYSLKMLSSASGFSLMGTFMTQMLRGLNVVVKNATNLVCNVVLMFELCVIWFYLFKVHLYI